VVAAALNHAGCVEYVASHLQQNLRRLHRLTVKVPFGVNSFARLTANAVLRECQHLVEQLGFAIGCEVDVLSEFLCRDPKDLLRLSSSCLLCVCCLLLCLCHLPISFYALILILVPLSIKSQVPFSYATTCCPSSMFLTFVIFISPSKVLETIIPSTNSSTFTLRSCVFAAIFSVSCVSVCVVFLSVMLLVYNRNGAKSTPFHR